MYKRSEAYLTAKKITIYKGERERDRDRERERQRELFNTTKQNNGCGRVKLSRYQSHRLQNEPTCGTMVYTAVGSSKEVLKKREREERKRGEKERER